MRRAPDIHTRLWVPGALPSLNDLLDAQRRVRRGKATLYTQLKARATAHVELHCRAQLHRRMTLPPACFTALVVTAHRRRDPDNLLSGAIKMLLDGLVRAGALANDGWKQVLGVGGYVATGDEPGALLVAADSLLPRSRMLELVPAY